MNLEQIPSKFQNLLKKTFSGDVSPRKAIKAKCYDCVCFENVKEQISNCSITACPLYQYRPYKDVKNEN
ncbi:hypothetical protein OAT67_02360 [Bacteriovoracaceae bacterium]|nr:hypothetical protein [Bacteriovoracaceae bacterium]